jgi:adenylate cyclase
VEAVSAANGAIEIERKFVLPALPPRELLGAGVRIAQLYLPEGPGEIRVRRKGAKHFMTAKDDGGLSRKEWEVEIPEWVFEVVRARCAAGLDKTRYTVREGEHEVLVDEYEGHLSGLVVLEVEFASEERAAAFVLPAWAKEAVEVTHDKRYKNRALAVSKP